MAAEKQPVKSIFIGRFLLNTKKVFIVTAEI